MSVRIDRGIFGALCFLGALLLGAVGGCGDDQSEECERRPDGEFSYRLDPPFPSGADSTANIRETAADVTLEAITPRAFVPPRIEYLFRYAAGRALVLEIDDLGGMSDLPVTVGQVYTLEFDLTQRLTPPSMGLKIFDDQGLLYVAVNDFRPNTDPNPDFSSIFEDGYGELGSEGELEVFFSDAGCDPRVENTACFARIVNRRLEFVVGGNKRLMLWQTEEGVIGDWTFHVFKSELVQAEANCFEGLLEQNGVSFSVSRNLQ